MKRIEFKRACTTTSKNIYFSFIHQTEEDYSNGLINFVEYINTMRNVLNNQAMTIEAQLRSDLSILNGE